MCIQYMCVHAYIYLYVSTYVCTNENNCTHMYELLWICTLQTGVIINTQTTINTHVYDVFVPVFVCLVPHLTASFDPAAQALSSRTKLCSKPLTWRNFFMAPLKNTQITIGLWLIMNDSV